VSDDDDDDSIPLCCSAWIHIHPYVTLSPGLNLASSSPIYIWATVLPRGNMVTPWGIIGNSTGWKW
jgi:hypothetical protein